jgi:hypothetical protein
VQRWQRILAEGFRRYLMILQKIAAVALGAMGLSSPAGGQPAGQVFHPRVMSWLYSDVRTVMIEDPQGQWYRVGLAADCQGLKTAVDVTIRDSSQGRPQLITGGGNCDIASMTQVSDASLYPAH